LRPETRTMRGDPYTCELLLVSGAGATSFPCPCCRITLRVGSGDDGEPIVHMRNVHRELGVVERLQVLAAVCPCGAPGGMTAFPSPRQNLRNRRSWGGGRRKFRWNRSRKAATRTPGLTNEDCRRVAQPARGA
jgi:hypothetical protein